MNAERLAVACRCPVDNVRANWPRIRQCLEALGIYSPLVAVAALATTAVETAWTFKPIKEFGGDKYLNEHYDTRTDLGNTPELDGDGARYCGRGFVQTTGHDNYVRASHATGLDLVADPDRVLDPDIAAQLMALFFKDHGVWVAANKMDWVRTRKLVNGGTNGLKEYLVCVTNLKALPTEDF